MRRVKLTGAAWLLISCLSVVLFIVFCNPMNVSAAGKNKAISVHTKIAGKIKQGAYYQAGIIKGVNKKGKTVWKYKTKYGLAVDGDSVTCFTKKDKVYIVAGGKIVVLKKTNGKKLLTINTSYHYNPLLDTDKYENIYVIELYPSQLSKYSSSGKLLWKTTEYFGRNYKLKYKNGKIIIKCEEGKAVLSSQDGAILKNTSPKWE